MTITLSNLNPSERQALVNKVKQFKEKYNLSYQGMESVLGVPATDSQIYMWTNGRSLPTGKRAIHLAEFFKLPQDEIERRVAAVPPKAKHGGHRTGIKKAKKKAVILLIQILKNQELIMAHLNIKSPVEQPVDIGQPMSIPIRSANGTNY